MKTLHKELKNYTDLELDELLTIITFDADEMHDEESIAVILAIIDEMELRHPNQFKIGEEEMKRHYDRFRERLFQEEGVLLSEYKPRAKDSKASVAL